MRKGSAAQPSPDHACTAGRYSGRRSSSTGPDPACVSGTGLMVSADFAATSTAPLPVATMLSLTAG